MSASAIQSEQFERDINIPTACGVNGSCCWNVDVSFKLQKATGSELIKTLRGHTGWVNSLAVLQNGYLASGCADKTLIVWKF